MLSQSFRSGWANTSLWEAAKFLIPTILALVALWVSLKDRRPKLILKARKGTWAHVNRMTNRQEIGFAAIIEVYNVSTRSNAIREYRFWTRNEDDEWELMESERYEVKFTEEDEPRVYNHTPLPIPPNSGAEVKIEAFTPLKKIRNVKVEIEDVFEKRYTIELPIER
jgi:hypothetical protein